MLRLSLLFPLLLLAGFFASTAEPGVTVENPVQQAAEDLLYSDRFEAIPFKDCAECPSMMMIPVGTFIQGSPESAPQSIGNERPQRTVDVPA